MVAWLSHSLLRSSGDSGPHPLDLFNKARYLLHEAGVATLSGTGFGEYGEGYIRLSYANSLENIGEALDRIKMAVARLVK